MSIIRAACNTKRGEGAKTGRGAGDGRGRGRSRPLGPGVLRGERRSGSSEGGAARGIRRGVSKDRGGWGTHWVWRGRVARSGRGGGGARRARRERERGAAGGRWRGERSVLVGRAAAGALGAPASVAERGPRAEGSEARCVFAARGARCCAVRALSGLLGASRCDLERRSSVCETGRRGSRRGGAPQAVSRASEVG